MGNDKACNRDKKKATRLVSVTRFIIAYRKHGTSFL